jgi:hypothetical protein
MEVLPVTLQYHLMFWKNTSCLLLHLVQKWTHCFRFVNHLMYCRFWRKWNTRKLYPKFCMAIFIWFIRYIGFHSENPLYETVLYPHKPKECALHSAVTDSSWKWSVKEDIQWCSVLYTWWLDWQCASPLVAIKLAVSEFTFHCFFWKNMSCLLLFLFNNEHYLKCVHHLMHCWSLTYLLQGAESLRS